MFLLPPPPKKIEIDSITPLLPFFPSLLLVLNKYLHIYGRWRISVLAFSSLRGTRAKNYIPEENSHSTDISTLLPYEQKEGTISVSQVQGKSVKEETHILCKCLLGLFCRESH